MIGFTVYLNGKRMTVAGAEDLCVLSATVNAVGDLGASTVRVGKRHGVNLHMSMSVGGLTRRAEGVPDEHLRWIKLRRLKVGDKISVQIVRTIKPDRYKNATPAVRESKQQIKTRMRRLKLAMKRPSGPKRTTGAAKR